MKAITKWMAAFTAFLTTGAALASSGGDISVVLFPTPQALPLYVASEKGFFAEQGLQVELTRTPDSPYLVRNVAENIFQVALAGIDNFIAYQEGQHVAEYRPGRDIAVFLGGGETNLPLVVQPEIERLVDLRGKTLAVDTPVTGFAFVLYEMLEQAGLSRENYKIVEAGATNRRWAGLREGDFDGTLLVDGLAHAARNQGFNVLADSRDVLGTYQGTVLAANSAWAEENSDDLIRFTTAVLDALDWLYDADNSDEAGDILARNMDMPANAARGAVAGLTNGRALTRDGSVLMDGIQVVLDLRSRYTGKQLGDPKAYLDLRYYEEAKRRRQR